MPIELDIAEPSELRSFGRRRGRKVSPRQRQLMESVLPRVGLDLSAPCATDVRRLFASPVDEVWLEIGFGGGEHLLWQAGRNPRVGLIGAEPFEDGVVKVLDAIERDALANVRVWPDDARGLLRWLPASSLARAFILFPDPWPKARHKKRRLFAAATLDLLARALRPDGELRAATDIADYAGVMLAAAAAHPAFAWTARRPDDWRRRPDDWPETRYERKAAAAGRRSTYLTFRRV